MPKKITKQTSGGWVNESINPKARAILDKLEIESRDIDRIGELLGFYRLQRESQDTAPTTGAAIRHIRQAQAAIDDLLAKLELMPEDFKALATDDYLKLTGEVYEQAHERLEADLFRFKAVCGSASRKMEAWPKAKGETPKYLEHKLLSEVAEILKPYVSGLEARADTAAKVLRAAGIKFIPVDKKKARAAILSYERNK